MASTAFSQLQLLEWSGSRSWEGNCLLAELATEAIFLSPLQRLHTGNETERARQATHTGLKCPGLLSFHPQGPLRPGPVSPSTARSPITRSPALTLDAGVALPCSMPRQITKGVGSRPVLRAALCSAVGHFVFVEKSPCSVLGSREESLALPVRSPCRALTLLQLCVANGARVVPVILLEEVPPLLDEFPQG